MVVSRRWCREDRQSAGTCARPADRRTFGPGVWCL